MNAASKHSIRLSRLVRAAVTLLAVAGATPVAAQNPTPPATPPAAPTAPVTSTTPAQDAASARLGRPVSSQELSDAIRKSGMSQAQIKARLQDAGYDPALADPFFSGSSASTTEGNSTFGQALRNLGLLSDPVPETSDDTQEMPLDDADEVEAPDRGAARVSTPRQVFGQSVFTRSARVFEVVPTGPVDASYRLGTGDQLQLIITGALEAGYQLDVRRDGTIVIPQVGQVSVAGLTLEAARAAVRKRAEVYYSALATKRATLDMSVSRVRSNAIFVIGEVRSPGTYQVNGLATVFGALARAGGPSVNGSFRDVELRRGGTVVRRFDLYKYLLTGDASDDVRMEQGDVLYVPLNQRAVALAGAVRRPAVYELRAGEGLAELMAFAGGMLSTAAAERIQIDRVLPMEQRTPGRDRVVLDIPLTKGIGALANVPLYDHDVVRVFGIGRLRRNSVTISGAVFQPGLYEYGPDMTLRQLVEKAQGFLPWALTDRVKVTRTITTTGASEVLSVDLQADSTKDLPIREFDDVVVLDGREVYQRGIIQVSGAVRRAGTRAFAENLTLGDVIDLAGGLRESAYLVEVARRRVTAEYSDTTSVVTRFTLDSAGELTPAARRFALLKDDRIYVRAAPGNRQQRFAELSGLFRLTGPYAINEHSDRVADVVQRAGGVLPGAFASSFRLIRGGRPVAIDFDEALRRNPQHNIVLVHGDQLSIGPRAATVFVTGDVERPSLVLWTDGMSIEEYVARAGGTRPNGDLDRTIVEQPTGRIDRVERKFLLFHLQPEIQAGSTITVPAKPPSDRDLSKVATTIFQITSSVASLAIAYIAIKR